MALFDDIKTQEPQGLFSGIKVQDNSSPINLSTTSFKTAESTPMVPTEKNKLSSFLTDPFVGIFNTIKNTVTGAGSTLKSAGEFAKALATNPAQTINNTSVGVYNGLNNEVANWLAENKQGADLAVKVKNNTATPEERSLLQQRYKKMAETANMLVLGFTVGGGNIAGDIEAIAKSSSASEIGGILKKLGTPDEFLKPAANMFSKIDDPALVSKIMQAEIVPRIPKLGSAVPGETGGMKNIFGSTEADVQTAKNVAVAKDPVVIKKLLGGTNVDPAQIDTLSHVLASIDDPKKVSNIIKGFDKTITPEVTAPKTPLKFSSEGIPLATNTIEARLARKANTSGSSLFQESQPSITLSQENGSLNADQSPITKGSITPQTRSLQLSSEANQGGNTNISSLDKIIHNTPTPVNQKVNLLDYVRTPDRVLEKIGLGPESKIIHTQYEKYVKELPKNIDKITAWSKEVPAASNERIFRSLDGENISLNPTETKVAGEIKDWLSQWADRLGLPADNRISKYITHIFDDQLIKKEFDEDLAKIIADKVPGSVYDPFLLKRLGALGYKQDTWAALDAYVKRATRKVHMDPALEKIQTKSKNLEQSQYDYVKSYVDQINMRPTKADNLLDNGIKSIIGYKLGGRPTMRILGALRRMTYRAFLGLNVGSALKNLSQGVNTYAVLGEKYTAIGYTKLLSPSARQEIIDEGILSEHFIQDRTMTAMKKTMQKVDKGLFAFFETAEKINRGAAYLGAKSKALSLGKTEEQAVAFAKKVVRDTQFSFGSVDTPVVLQSDIMKTLGQFQSYTTKQIEFLTEMAKNKNYLGLIRYIIGGVIIVETLGKLFGMEPKDLLPIYRIGVPASLKLPYELGRAAVNAPDKYGNPRDTNQKAQDVGNAALGLVPASSQGKKTYQGAKAVMEGGSFTKAGNKQFSVGGTTYKNVQAFIFGKYAGQEAKDYFNKTVSKEEQAYNDAVAKDKEASLKETNRIKPIYDEAQKLNSEGKIDEAKNLVNSLSDGDYEIYKKIRTAEKTKQTVQGKKDIFPIYQKAQELKSQGKDAEAMDLVNSLTDDQYKYYQLIKKQLENSATVESDSKGNILNVLFGVKTASAAEMPTDQKGIISVPPKYGVALEDVYSRYPEVPKGLVETVLLMESSMGQNKVNRTRDYGKYGYIAGHTKTGNFQSLMKTAEKNPKLEAKIKVLEKNNEGQYAVTNIKNLGDEYAAIQATGSVLAGLIRNNPKANIADVYFKRYVTAKASDTLERRTLFNKAISYYSQN